MLMKKAGIIGIVVGGAALVGAGIVTYLKMKNPPQEIDF